MGKDWSFRYDIAKPLEDYTKKYIHSESYSADEIICGSFADAVAGILSQLYHNRDDYSDVMEMLNLVDHLPATEIDKELAIEIFDNLKRLIQIKETSI